MMRFRGISLQQTGSTVRLLSTASERVQPKVTIPPAVKRSPTDLLKALSDTVGVDPTAPHFAFIDDPATIPTTAQNMRHYYMSKEMGKRAARQLAEEWPTLFAFDRDQPRLPAFRPQKAHDPMKVDPTESNLMSMIEKREVLDASMLYERMRSEDIEVSQPVQLELFRLACYYNSTNPPFAEWEQWHGMRNFGQQEPSQWLEAGLAELLFESLPQTPETVSILICGLCKHATANSIKRAQQLYKDHSSGLSREAFDSLISVSPWNSTAKLAAQMKAAGHAPSIHTFNAMLKSAATSFKSTRGREEKVAAYQSVLGEMTSLGLSPSLLSFHLVFDQLVEWKALEEARSAGKVDATLEGQARLAITWLSECLTALESRPRLTIQSADDHLFFNSTMYIATRCGNLEMAERLVSLYESASNEVKMPAFTSESTFYNRYLMLFIEQTSSIEAVDAKYRSLVPRLVGLNRNLSMAISEKLQSHHHWPLLLRVIEDGICARQMTDHRMGQLFRQRLIDVPFESLSVSERDEFSSLVRRMVDIWTEFSRFTEERMKRNQMKLSPSMIAESAVLLNRIGDSERAFSLLEMLLSTEATQGEEATVMATGFARPSAMSELFEDSLRQGDAVKAATCLEIMSSGTPRNKLEMMAQRIHDRCTVTEAQSRLINVFVRLRPQ